MAVASVQTLLLSAAVTQRFEIAVLVLGVLLVLAALASGLEVDGEMLQRHWHLPLRKLVLARASWRSSSSASSSSSARC